MKYLAILAAVIVLTCALPTKAQPIRVAVRGVDGMERSVQPLHASGAAITITTQQLAEAAGFPGNPWYGYEFVRIYDVNGVGGAVPSADIGPVVITGNSTIPAQIRVLVAPPDQAGQNGSPDFSSDPEFEMRFPGARNFRSLTVGAELAGKVRCAIAVTHDIGSGSAIPRDQITVAQVYHLRARGQTDVDGNIVAGGNIYADVTATMNSADFRASGTPFPSFSAIGFVFAGQSLQGDLVATGDPISLIEFTRLNSIRKVVVGLNPCRAPIVVGITGDIRAERGRIGSIFCDGPIGTPQRLSQIRAGSGIDEIYSACLDDNGVPYQPTEEDIHADVQSGMFYTATGQPATDGPLVALRTDGDFRGVIRVPNLVAGAAFGGQSGILIRGVVDAPITVDYVMDRSSILGASFPQPITIGYHARGAIVAGLGDEFMHSVTIGFATNVPTLYATNFPRGFTGSICPPVDPRVTVPYDAHSLDDWLTPIGDAAEIFGLDLELVCPNDPDSTVRARHIGTARIYQMTTVCGCVTGIPQFCCPDGGRSRYVPRIEAEQIDLLEVGELREGYIRSAGVYTDDVNVNDHARVGSLDMGPVGSNATIKFEPLGPARFRGDVLGRIVLPSLPASRTIVIDGRFISLPDCGCAPSPGECPYPEPIGLNRYVRASCLRPNNLAMHVLGAQGLGGQVIINAAGLVAPEADAWIAYTTVGPFFNGYNLGPAHPQPDTTPFYDRTSAELGGGAIGVAPFHLHRADCRPPDRQLDPAPLSQQPRGVYETEFDDPQNPNAVPVRMRFYGPIRRSTSSWNTAVVIECRPIGAGNCGWAPAGQGFIVRGPGDAGWTERRAIGLSAAPGSRIRTGIYRIRLVGVLCDDVQGNQPVVAPSDVLSCDEEAFVFRINPDCDRDGIDDEVDTDRNCTSNCHIADFNSDGTITVQDLFDFLAAYFAGCLGPGQPDPACVRSANIDGFPGISVQDIFEFLGEWFGCR